ncbi:MAG: adenosine deaminase [Candidatus Krumholzibacteriia bacterium]
MHISSSQGRVPGLRGHDPEAGADLYLCRVPKVELHVHLEGAIRPVRLLRILERRALHPEWRRPEDLAWLFRHSSFEEFLDHFRFVVTSLRDVQDVHDVARDLFLELAAQNVVYAEVLFSAAIFVRQGMPWDELLAAVVEAESAAFAAARRSGTPTPDEPSRRYNIVVDLVRNFGPEFALQQVEGLARADHPRVVGIHLGGDEVGFPARLFADAYRVAREAGLGLAAHAGEADGPASVRDALDVLGVQRVGHGIRSLEDPGLVREIVERGITLEVCPTSNVRTCVVPKLEEHPLPELLQRGVRVTLGSDDPSYFDTDITREMQAAHAVLGLNLARLDCVVDEGLRAAFIPAEEKNAWLEKVRARRASLRRQLGLPPEV